MDTQVPSTSQVKATIDITKEAATETWSLARYRQSGSPSEILQLHQDLVVSRIVCLSSRVLLHTFALI